MHHYKLQHTLHTTLLLSLLIFFSPLHQLQQIVVFIRPLLPIHGLPSD